MTDEYARYRKFFLRCFAVGCVLALLTTGITIWRIHQEKWAVLSSDKLARLSVEEAVYEDDADTPCFLRIRITNQSTRAFSVDLRDSKDQWKPLHILRAGFNEGDHFVISEMIPLLLAEDVKVREQKILRAMRSRKTGNLVLIAPGASAEYFAATGTSHAEIARIYHRAPLWIRAKTYWPRAPFPLHFIATLRGSLFYSDGRSASSRTLYRHDVGIRFPLMWKQLPEKARLMSNEQNTFRKSADAQKRKPMRFTAQ